MLGAAGERSLASKEPRCWQTRLTRARVISKTEPRRESLWGDLGGPYTNAHFRVLLD